MKIRLSELKSIIREELDSAAAYKLYKTYNDHRHSNDPTQSTIRDASYGHYKDLPGLFDLRAKSSDYNTFFWAIKRDPSRKDLDPNRMHSFYHSKIETPEELEAAAKEYKDVMERFKKERVPNETDMYYGRNTYRVVDKKTGDVVDTYRDREGSLGT